MLFKIVTMPFSPEAGTFMVEEAERFVAGKKVLSVRPSCFKAGGRVYWSAFIVYEPVVEPEPPRAADDPYAKLTEAQKGLLASLKQWRNEKAASEGYPPYLLATNRQLAEIILRAPRTLEGLKEVRGMGDKKLEKYGAAILALVGGGDGKD